VHIAVAELQGDGVIAVVAVHFLDKRAFLPVGFLTAIGAVFKKLLTSVKYIPIVSHLITSKVLGQHQHAELSPNSPERLGLLSLIPPG
jgi:hypothetical protein